jgi:hypothetical protein
VRARVLGCSARGLGAWPLGPNTFFFAIICYAMEAMQVNPRLCNGARHSCTGLCLMLLMQVLAVGA